MSRAGPEIPCPLYCLHLSWVCPQRPVFSSPTPGHQSGFCMMCVMQNHVTQAFANSGSVIKPVSFVRDLKSKDGCPRVPSCSRAGGQRLLQEQNL